MCGAKQTEARCVLRAGCTRLLSFLSSPRDGSDCTARGTMYCTGVDVVELLSSLVRRHLAELALAACERRCPPPREEQQARAAVAAGLKHSLDAQLK